MQVASKGGFFFRGNIRGNNLQTSLGRDSTFSVGSLALAIWQCLFLPNGPCTPFRRGFFVQNTCTAMSGLRATRVGSLRHPAQAGVGCRASGEEAAWGDGGLC